MSNAQVVHLSQPGAGNFNRLIEGHDWLEFVQVGDLMNSLCPLRCVTPTLIILTMTCTARTVNAAVIDQQRAPLPSFETLNQQPNIPRMIVAVPATSVHQLEQEIYQQINQYRAKFGLNPLIVDPTLGYQAKLHSQAMASGQRKFSHDGLAVRMKAVGNVMPVQSLAENIAYNSGQAKPGNQAVQSWLRSSPHHANILGRFDKTGIGVAISPNGQYYFTQLFLTLRK